jgi:hypothetical protein
MKIRVVGVRLHPFDYVIRDFTKSEDAKKFARHLQRLGYEVRTGAPAKGVRQTAGGRLKVWG